MALKPDNYSQNVNCTGKSYKENSVKIAILHDYLNQYGGAERVVEAFLEMFPDADVYTLLYDKRRTLGRFDKNVVRTSFLDSKIVRGKHRFFIPLMPVASRFLKARKEYDLVISSSAGYAKGFNVEAPFHVCYCHSPLRYAWERNYLKNLSFAPWPLREFFVYPVAEFLKKWDKKSSSNVNLYVTNSNFISRKVNSYYGRESEVVYPPVDTEKFYPEFDEKLAGEEYYMMAGRLLYYKLFDLGIKAFNKLKKKLVIVGSGPELDKLKKIAGKNIIFIPYVTDEDMRLFYSNAKAFIFPQIEDFGLVAAEAQACGLSVIGYNGGGAREIIEEGKTGIFFGRQDTASLVKAVKGFENMRFDNNYIAKRAQKFSKDNFKNNFLKVLKNSGFVF